MSHILANNGDRNLMLVSISMFSGSKKPNRINIICLSLVLFQNGCHSFSKWLPRQIWRGIIIPCCPGGTFSLPGELRSNVISSQGTEYRKATAFSVAKGLSHSCCVKIPECRASASTKCEPETFTTNRLRHTNAYDYNIYVNSSENILVHPMFSSISGIYEHPSVRLFVCTTHQPCKVTRGKR